MGIQGLLPFLKKIHEPVNVSKFAGCTVAIDAYCWLHKGAFSCAEKLALGEKTDQYVYYCLKYINYLLSKNVKPIMVFDGCHLPSKKNVEKTRREKRELNKKKAAQFLREGKRAEARECLQRCIDISPEMALELMSNCRERGVDCIVAPYEADAQLAYLNKIGIAQVIITEDSDLLLFGCEKVLFKMDHAGNGILIEQRKLNEVMQIQSGQYSFEKFRYMCILSGCDYMPSLSGIGLVRANKVFKVARQSDIAQLLKKLPAYLKTNLVVPPEYIDGFIAANNTFLYQFVFDPLQTKLVPLNPYPDEINPADLAYAGAQIPLNKALQIALGNINIYSGERFASFHPDSFVPKYVKKKSEMLHMLSIWNRNYRVKPKTVLHHAQTPERPSLKGKEVSVRTTLLKHRRSPRKRVRDIEEHSSTELCDLYTSPANKKCKVDDETDDDLYRFMFASQTEAGADDTGEDASTLDTSRGPKFFNSLSNAHPEIKEELEQKVDSESGKENGLLSPGRNIFANKSPSKKPKFNLNAPKQGELKSRFFSSSAQVKAGISTKYAVKDAPGTSKMQYKPIHCNTANVYNNARSNMPTDDTSCTNTSVDVIENSSIIHIENTSIGPVENCEIKMEKEHDCTATSDMSELITEVPCRQPFKFSGVGATKRSSPISSPRGGSAFNWSKFKFNRLGSCDISVSQKRKDSKLPFKKVMSESSLSIYLKKADHFDSQTDMNADISECNKYVEHEQVAGLESEPVVSKDLENQQNSTSSSVSFGSYPYSVDSDCVADFNLLESESGHQMSQTSSQESDTSSHNESILPENKLKRKSSLSIYFKTNNSKDSNLTADDSASDIGGSEHTGSTDTTQAVYDQDCCERRDQCSAEAGKQDVIVVNSDDEMESRGQVSQSSAMRKAAGTVNKVNRFNGKTKTGCKVSGLSRRSKKSPGNQDAMNKQQNLKDMFARFSHDKSDRQRLSHSDADEAFTPEGASSLVGRTSDIQKSLLI